MGWRVRLADEIDRLADLAERGGVADGSLRAGFELEAWLVDATGRPAPRAVALCERLACAGLRCAALPSSVVIHVPAHAVAGEGLMHLQRHFERCWARCESLAHEMGLHLVAVGTLPSLREADLHRRIATPWTLQRARRPAPSHRGEGHGPQLDIEGTDGRHLRGSFADAARPEAAAGTLSLQLQLPARAMDRAYNASLAAAAPLVALAGNSPLLFGQPLCQETRIPLLEQAHATRAALLAGSTGHPAVSGGWVGGPPLACLRAAVLAAQPPPDARTACGSLERLQRHGTAFGRWSRPRIGFGSDGRPELHLEHGTLPAGPGLGDMMAHVAAAIGVFVNWAGAATPPECRLSFEDAAANLHAAARDGLGARLRWLDGREASAGEAARDLLRDARSGLASLAVDPAAAAGWLDRLEQRLATRRTGARWQLARLQLRRGDLGAMTRDYVQRQASGEPVHAWS